MKKLFLLSLLLSSSCFAELNTVGRYESMSQTDKSATGLYIMGIGEGASWAQIYGISFKNKKLYCMPPNLAMNINNYVQLLETGIQKLKARKPNSYQNEMIDTVLIDELISNFPCR